MTGQDCRTSSPVSLSESSSSTQPCITIRCDLDSQIPNCAPISAASFLDYDFVSSAKGYHDVAITFLLVVGEMLGYHIMQRLSISHLKEFMAPTMDKTTYLLHYMYPLVNICLIVNSCRHMFI